MTKPITVYQFMLGRDEVTKQESWFAITEDGRIVCYVVVPTRAQGVLLAGPNGPYGSEFPKHRRLVILDDGQVPPDEVMLAAGFTRPVEAPQVIAIDEIDEITAASSAEAALFLEDGRAVPEPSGHHEITLDLAPHDSYTTTATTRTFTRLNHPEPEDDGTQLYSMHERVDGEWTRVADGLTLEETDAFVAQNGVWEPANGYFTPGAAEFDVVVDGEHFPKWDTGPMPAPEPRHRGVDFGWNNDEKRAPMYGSRDEDGM